MYSWRGSPHISLMKQREDMNYLRKQKPYTLTLALKSDIVLLQALISDCSVVEMLEKLQFAMMFFSHSDMFFHSENPWRDFNLLEYQFNIRLPHYLLGLGAVVSTLAHRSVVSQRLVPSQGNGQVVQAGVHIATLALLTRQRLQPVVHPFILG